MEKRYESLSIYEFSEKYPDDDTCLAHLADMKWKNGFVCSKCKSDKYCAAVRKYDRQCTKCRHINSPTSGTLFHMCKFSILKAFHIVYFVSTSKSGIASTELSRKLQLSQKTCWLFKQKVMKAMESSKTLLMEGKVEVDETFVGGQDNKAIGRNEGKKKIVVIGIERKGKGISRIYGKVIPTAARVNLKGFMVDHISPEADVKTDGWSGYRGLLETFPKLVQEKSEKKGKNFHQMHRAIMMLKAWLRGIHHSVDYLQAYIDEYTYRFNRNKMKKGIFDNLLERMVAKPPYPYKMFIS